MKKIFFANAISRESGSIALLLLRWGLGGVMAFNHGWPKFSTFSEKKDQFLQFMGMSSEISLGLATFAEFFCALLLILGFFTRLATIPLIITMLTALGIVHGWDIAGHETPFLILIGMTAILFAGPGKYSVDAMIYPKKS